jgi:hypothetical protein
MSKTKFEKKKAREKEVKKKVLARRAVSRAQTKKEREEEKKRRDLQRATNKIEGKTIRIRADKQVVSQLSHNLEILKALEAEAKLLKEAQENAPMINTSGLPICQDEEPKDNKGLGASADVVFIPNTTTDDTKETNEPG